MLNEVKEQLSRNLAQTRDDIEEKETACSLLSRIMEMNTSIDKKYERLKGLKADVDSARNRIYECEEAAASANSAYNTLLTKDILEILKKPLNKGYELELSVRNDELMIKYKYTWKQN